MLRVEGLTFGYGALPVVEDVSLAVAPGERVALLGGNGAGKSTVLKLIAGLERPWAGTIATDFGQSIPGRPHATAQSGIRMVPQGHPVFASMSVRDHLRLAAEQGARGRRDVATRITEAEALAMFPRLAERLETSASSLSGGERAFIGVAQALLGGCSLLLLDEPSAGLSPAAIEALFTLLGEIGAATLLPMLIVEQNAAAALRVADRAYVMNQGRVVLSGTPDELYANDDIVAAYLSF